MSRFARLFPLGLLMAGPLAAAGGSLPPLPAAVASFGAAVDGDDLYVYGGHVGETHQHSVDNLSPAFFHLDLAAPEAGWRELAPVPGLQGLAMVAHGGEVCRIGGLAARNRAGEPEDLVSVADVLCYEPATGRWRELPPLPAPRSSHDAVVLGDRLFVVGGWQLRGAGTETVWHEEMAVLELTASDPAWRSLPQPFERRALALAAAGGKVFALGGLGRDGVSRAVEVFDPASESWSPGPELPETSGRLHGFGVAAYGVGERVWISGADGVVHALDALTGRWEEGLGHLATPRFFHRLLPHRDRLLFLGGAAAGAGHLADVEALPLAALSAAAEEAAAPTPPAGSWPGLHGPGDGYAPSPEVPVEWSDADVAWRVHLTGYGQSSPVVWGGQVFVTEAEGKEKETLIVSALDLATGEVRWRRRFATSHRQAATDMVSKSAPTPAVDATGLYVFWESGDLVALTHDGETVWHRSLTREYGPVEGNHGLGSSLRLTDEAVIVQVTHAGPSYYLAVDKATGENRWKADRPAKVAWTTPILLAANGHAELLISAGGRVEALDAATGDRLWSIEGIEKNHIPSAVAAAELVVVASSEPGQSLALRRTVDGKVDPSSIAWRVNGVSSGFASPVIQGPCVAFVNDAGVVSCVDRETGREKWKHRLADACWASPIVAGDRVYFFTKKGATTVLRLEEAGPVIVAENPLTVEGTVYGVAAVRDAFLLRTDHELIRVGRP